jgi:hypothetical protein
MPRPTFTALQTEIVQAYRSGAPDANGQPAERATCSGDKYAPCRHCLKYIPEGAEMLILAHRPFDAPQPYAESGPIFLCAGDCARWDRPETPPVVGESDEDRLVKAYSPDDRIVYGLGKIVAPSDVAERARTVLADPRVQYVHVRSSSNNCFTCRVDNVDEV